jgi:hypothetical protein
MRMKNIKKAALFVLGLVVLLATSSALIGPKDYAAFNYADVRTKLKSLDKEADYSIDVVCAGNSQSFYACSPLLIYKEFGFTSYDTGTAGQRLCDTYAVLSETYKTQAPKLVVLEVDGVIDAHPGVHEKEDDYFFNAAETVFPILHYHSVYYSSLPKSLVNLTSSRRNEKLLKGYHLRTDVKPYDTDGEDSDAYMYVDEDYQMTDTAKSYLEKIVDLARSQGSEIMFLSAPSATNWTMNKHEAVSEIAESKGIYYLDMNLQLEKIGIDWEVDTCDGGEHLNSSGAKKTSSYLGRFIIENFPGIFDKPEGLSDTAKTALEVKEKQIKENWDRDYESYMNLLKEG